MTKQTKFYIEVVLKFFMYGAILVETLNTVGSVLYAIYLWGSEDLPLAKALWEAAKTWLLVFVSCLAIILLSITGLVRVNEKNKY